ncbi:FecCD family ABC transporter permease [Alloyangia pacifica]|uniref:Iron complex transport system permease protein n=1 Tax=Alloyangia pacifica TaxID=311180 RepID=A0A1I6SXU6_9RHOB|nr:iron ABC transporter permease [Alloyangia pacifica]SDG90968.1 iron complex transport system permease protein [Alloyangia pacifica]SFS81791.1 iron complex transport system permease protein [Alloyangia pacifica]
MRFAVTLLGGLALLLAAAAASLGLGATAIAPGEVVGAFLAFDPDNLDHYLVLTQRLPRTLIAAYVGAVMAVGGAAMQGVTGNPLASPSTLGVSAGAMLGMLLSVYGFGAGLGVQGLSALAGGFAGFAMTLAVARMTGLGPDPRGLPLILSGALTGMLLAGLSGALLLTDPARRAEYLSWLAGNINHFYADRLVAFWPLGLVATLTLLALARPLTLIGLGTERAAAMGVRVRPVTQAALAAVVLGASSATAICGPIAFVGLVVPHLVRPFTGAHLARLLPASAQVGAALCLLSDVLARRAFAPFTLHTGVLLELVGGVCFGVLIYRLYLRPGAAR